MKVLLLGATGNLGSRLLPALQAHGHTVVVFVRSEAKLKQLVPFSVVSKATIATGNASNSNAVREALVNNRCDALVNSAGQASIFPWQDPRMQDIIKRFPMFTEHLHTLAQLQAQSPEHLQWSLFCPSVMLPASKTIEALETPHGNPLLTAKDEPPNFQNFYISWIPFLGPLVTTVGNAGRYNTTLEDCADFIAADLKSGEKSFVGHRVGVYDAGKTKKT